jgi:hypothetical protein
MLKRNYQEMRDLINSAGGRFMSVTFIKKDGSERLMNIQPAAIVKKIKDPETVSAIDKQRTAARKANNPHLMPVVDVQIGAVRSVNLDTVKLIVIDHKEYRYE